MTALKEQFKATVDGKLLLVRRYADDHVTAEFKDTVADVWLGEVDLERESVEFTTPDIRWCGHHGKYVTVADHSEELGHPHPSGMAPVFDVWRLDCGHEVQQQTGRFEAVV